MKKQTWSKRFLSGLLVLVLALSMLPSAALAAETGPTLISTEAELKGMKLDGSYKLTNNIELKAAWAPIGNDNKPFTGTLDGAGYTISKLNVNYTDATLNLGLFGVVGADGIIENLTVEGSVTGAKNYIGGIAGKSSGTIRNCINKAAVSGGTAGQFIGGIVGGVEGSSITQSAKVTGCANLGNIEGKNNVGGIAGQGKFSDISYCYNAATVSDTVKGRSLGGLVGNTVSGGEISRCYNVGQVNITKSSSNAGILVGRLYDMSMKYCYWLSDIAGTLPSHNESGTITNLSAKTQEELKAPEFINTLNEGAPEGSRFVADAQNINQGYPVLECQLPKVEKFQVAFALTPENAALTVKDAAGATQAGASGVYRLPAGEYTYSASAFGYDNASGSFTVADVSDPGTVPVTLTETQRQKVTFSGLPQGASLTLSHSVAGVLAAESDGSYRLPAGEYRYTVVAKGYEPLVDQTVTVAAQDVSVPVSMTLLGEAQPWDGTSKEAVTPIGGTYYIKTGAELAWFAAQINAKSLLNAKVVLLADIDLGDKDWKSIGTPNTVKFNGGFDGNNCTISGLSGECFGLFGQIDKNGTVENLTVSGSITGSYNTGGIVGVNSGTVRNCASYVTVAATDQRVGGVVGDNSGGTISGCAALAPVSSNYSSFANIVKLGAIAGQNSGTIEYSYSVAVIDARGKNHNGGVGGITGENTGSVKNCYNAGTVSYAEGAEKATGAIAGNASSGSVENSFYLDSSCAKGIGDGSQDGAQAKTAAEMKKYTLALALNGGSVEGPFYLAADETENGGYPVLKWQGGKPPVASPDERAVAADKSALTLPQKSYTRPGAISLPASGAAGSSIAWTSDTPAVISDKGVVVLPTERSEVTVTLTATLTKGEAQDTKAFTIKVYSAAQVTLNYLAEAKAALRAPLAPVCGRDQNITALVQERLDDCGFGDVTVALKSSGLTSQGEGIYIAETGAITYYYRDPETTVYNRAIVRGLSFTLSKDGQSVDWDGVQANIPWDRARVLEALQTQVAANLTWDAIKGNNSVPEEITTPLTLPIKLESANWATISWETDSWAITPETPSVLDKQTTGTIYRQAVDAQVNLTAVISFNLTAPGEPDITLPVSFDLTVLGSEGADTPEKMQGKLNSYTLEKLKDSITKAVIDPSAVKGDLQFPTPANTGVADYAAYRFTVASKNTDVLEVNGYRGYIYRPLPGEQAVTVGFTVTMTSRKNSALSVSKDMEVTVLPLTQAEIDEALRLMEAVRADYSNALLGANTDRSAITTNLKTFREATFGEDGNTLVYSRSINNDTGRGVVVDDLPGSEPGGPGYEKWRTFRSSRPAILADEILLLTKPYYNESVTVESCLTHAVLGKYARKHPDNPYFKELYKAGIQAEFKVVGTSGEDNGNPEAKITATFSLDGKGFIESIPAISFDNLEQNTTAFDVFKQALASKGFTYEARGSYISAITDSKGARLAELDKGKDSGWMYTVNGVFPDKMMSAKYLNGGENIQVLYTGDWNQEPGVDSGMASQPNSGAVLKPKVTVDNSGAAKVEMTEKGLASAIQAAKANKAASIVIEPVINGKATKVTVELPKASLVAMATDASASLKIVMPTGNMTIPNDVLSAVASQASGAGVTVSLEAVEAKALTAEQQKTVGGDKVFDVTITSGGINISSFGGKRITVFLPYTLKSGENAGGVAVWYLNDAGKLERVACTYDNTTGLATFSTTHLSKYVVGYDGWNNPFADVSTADWFYDAVKYATKGELFSGTSATTFSPNADMTRAMLVTVLYRMEGKPAITAANAFMDVQPGQWYTDAVIWANANKIVEGYGNGIFGTGNLITREQIAVILYRYAKFKGYDVTKTTELAGFTDASAVGSWAASPMKWANAEGLITGTTDTLLDPTGTASRAQVAIILMRLMKNMAK